MPHKFALLAAGMACTCHINGCHIFLKTFFKRFKKLKTKKKNKNKGRNG
jgi:hypothetical protein